MMVAETETEEFVLARLAQELDSVGLEGRLEAACEAALGILRGEELAAEERELLERSADDEPLARLVGFRAERALRAGLRAASPDGPVAAAEAPRTEVVVLRTDGLDRRAHGRQMTRVLAHWRAYSAAREEGRAGRLWIVAPDALYEKVRQVMPSGRTSTAEEPGALASIAVAPLEAELPALESALRARLERLGIDAEDADAERIAWLAAHAAPGLAPPPLRSMGLSDDVFGDDELLVIEDDDAAEGDALPEEGDLLVVEEEPAFAEGADDLDARDPLIGRLFAGRYRVARCVRRAGFGADYEARDEAREESGAEGAPLVVLRVLFGDAADTAVADPAFQELARRLPRLAHPNVVGVRAFETTDDATSFFVLDEVPGEPFEATLSREGKLDPERAARLLLQIAEALRAAHHGTGRRALLHLDLKPACLVRVEEGGEERLLVRDFGIGRFLGDGQVEFVAGTDSAGDVIRATDVPGNELGPLSTLGFPGVGEALGCTPEYASPEQCAAALGDGTDPVDARSDLYSLGVLGFEMLTGRRPVEAADRLELLRAVTTDHGAAAREAAKLEGIPRGLVRFLVRCLAGEPAARWKDTETACRALHRAVHVGTLAKVVLPLAAAAALLLLWLGNREAAPLAPVPLASLAGVALGDEPLYLGPARSSAELELLLPEDVDVPPTDAGWQAVRSADGSVATGWSVEGTAPGRVALRGSSELGPGHLAEELQLVLPDGGLRTEVVHASWIGSEAWALAGVEVEGRALDTLRGVALDPLGAALTFEVRGAARDAVRHVWIDAGGEPLQPSASGEGEGRYSVELAALGLADGTHEVAIGLRDAAGREERRSDELTLLSSALELREVALVDLAAGRDAEGRAYALNRLGDESLVNPACTPALRIDLNRVADVHWEIRADESSAGEGRSTVGRSLGRQSFMAELPDLASLTGGTAFHGHIEVLADEAAYVLHSEGSERGRAERRLDFRYEASLPAFVAEWRAGSVRAPLRPDAEPLFTNAADGRVVVSRVADAGERLPLRVDVSWWPAGRPEERQQRTIDGLLDPDADRAEADVSLAADGEWVVRTSAYRFDPEGEAGSQRPDVEAEGRVVLDRRAPRTAVVGLEAGTVLSSLESSPDELRVVFDDLSPSAREAALDLDWRLERVEPVPALRSSGRLSDVDPRAGEIHLALGGVLRDAAGLADGTYRLAVAGNDRAGNRIEEASVDFVVALRGPDIELREPEGTLWSPAREDGRWPLRVRTSDPNGVALLRASWIAGDVAVPVELEPEGEPANGVLPEGAGRVRTWSGSVLFPDSLSRSRVQLNLEAVDERGATSTWTSAPFELPAIEGAAPERIAVSVDGHPAEALRLVRGNADFEYVFGGRGDSVENAAFLAAGLELFNPAPRRSRPRSWQVRFEPGAIEDFYLDEREVSVGQFLAFLREPGGYMERSHWPNGDLPDVRIGVALKERLSQLSPELPVTGITWIEANAYARWVGKRLPTWLEWEYAVRGGAAYRPSSAAGATIPGATAPAAGRSPDLRGRGDWTPGRAFADLCGNVAEWTATGFHPDAPEARYPNLWARSDPNRLRSAARLAPSYWIVGGHFDRPRMDFAAADHRRVGTRDGAVGFRCAISRADLQSRLGLEDADGPVFAEDF